jgi:hypothetical protein
MDVLGLDPKELTSAAGYPCKQLGQIMLIQPVQRAA